MLQRDSFGDAPVNPHIIWGFDSIKKAYDNTLRMARFECPRCGFTAFNQTRYISHLKRKNICHPTVSDNNLEAEYQKYGLLQQSLPDINDYVKDEGVKEYIFQVIQLVAKQIQQKQVELDQKDTELRLKEKELEEAKKQHEIANAKIDELIKKAGSTVTNNNNNTNNSHTVNNNFNIFTFKDPQSLSFSEEDIAAILEQVDRLPMLTSQLNMGDSDDESAYDESGVDGESAYHKSGDNVYNESSGEHVSALHTSTPISIPRS